MQAAMPPSRCRYEEKMRSPVRVMEPAAKRVRQMLTEPFAKGDAALVPVVEHTLALVTMQSAREHGEDVARDNELGGKSQYKFCEAHSEGNHSLQPPSSTVS